jgi:uncharacterized membrane protein
MEEWLRTVIGYVIPIVEGCGALVIVLEVARTIVQYLILFVRRTEISTRPLRIRLGQAMVMGLEFQVAADILRTATAPTWNDILLLAALIALRTVLNFLMELELRTLDKKESEEGA